MFLSNALDLYISLKLFSDIRKTRLNYFIVTTPKLHFAIVGLSRFNLVKMNVIVLLMYVTEKKHM